MRVVGLAGLLAAVGVLGLVGVRPAGSSPPPAMRLDPASIKLDAAAGTAFSVDVVIEGVVDLGAFEFELVFDPDFVKLVDVEVGLFPTSSDRSVTCQRRTIDAGIVEFGCNTPGAQPPGPTGSGVVARLDFTVQGRSFGETILRLRSCGAADVLGVAILSADCKDSKLTINPPTPTPAPNPGMSKLPPLQNLFLTRQGEKIPPVQCVGPQGGEDIAVFAEALTAPITSPDPKGSGETQQLSAFEFEVHYDDGKVCVELQPGPVAANMSCFIQDAVTKPALEGIARMGCVTQGKEGPVLDPATRDGRHLADILVRPQPVVYSQARPNRDNGVVVQLNNIGCELADLQGHPIKLFSCDDAELTIRYLEGDAAPDCSVTTLDTQLVAFSWGAEKGSALYSDWFNLEPSGAQADNDIDIKDLQFVYGRYGSTCADPHPSQLPVNPKPGATLTPTPTSTPTPGVTGTPKPRINKTPDVQHLLLTSPPVTGRCEDGQDAVSFEVTIKDAITSADPKNPSELQQLGAFELETRFDASYVCIEVAPGDIPLGEMSCLTQESSNLVHFGCKTMSSNVLPVPAPPGILAVITVRPRPEVYELLFAGEELVTQLSNAGCGLSDLLGHSIKSAECGGARIRIHYP